ncbi:hypothetical protein [Marinoscillum sp. MHG1-6]|uniref:hypothetical protein n=1 Tax=Marinoscillum sp. MHG1-6 TaxID=2959627 RepID=UPI0021573D70|nr:hypothetical protein [Marinoscillum sp. MHG1-6]
MKESDIPFKTRFGHRLIAWFFICLTIFYINSCTYFRVKEAAPLELDQALKSKIQEQIFVLHQGDQNYLLENVDLSPYDLSGTIKEVDRNIFYSEGRKKRYSEVEKEIIDEVHIYLNDQLVISPGEMSIPLAEMREIRIINQDLGKTFAAAVGSILIAYVFIVVIYLLTKSSCPYVYSNDGESYVFEGELFGGAILPNLERDDYVPLSSIVRVDNEYRLLISNELKEKQYLDLANLLVVDHPAGTKVLLDRKGFPRLISAPISPLSVKTLGDSDVYEELAQNDQKPYYFDDEGLYDNALFLEFERGKDASSANLLINAKNTLWFDYLSGEVFEKLGTSFDRWMEMQESLSTEERIQNLEDRNVPLSVSVLKNGNWHLVDKIPTVGPLAYRELTVPIDLTDMQEEVVQIKIETGYRFWEIDHVALSYAENEPLQVKRVLPSLAQDLDNHEFSEELSKTDGIYLAQLNTGDVVNITYKAPAPTEGLTQSVFLHTRGYYELVRNFENSIQLTEVSRFKKPSYLAEYSLIRYRDFIEAAEEFIAHN